MVRARIGTLLDGRDIWWSLGEPAKPAAELASLVRTTIVPFLDEIHEPAAFDAFLARSVEGKRHPDLATQIYRAVRMQYQGHDEDARRLLREVAESPSAWHDRALEVAGRLFPRSDLD